MRDIILYYFVFILCVLHVIDTLLENQFSEQLVSKTFIKKWYSSLAAMSLFFTFVLLVTSFKIIYYRLDYTLEQRIMEIQSLASASPSTW